MRSIPIFPRIRTQIFFRGNGLLKHVSQLCTWPQVTFPSTSLDVYKISNIENKDQLCGIVRSNLVMKVIVVVFLHQVYWVGPIPGAIMGALLYEHVFSASKMAVTPA